MGRRVRIMSALVAGTLAFVVGTSTAHAILKSDQYKCQTAIAKEGASYLTKKLKLIQKCKDADLATPGSCAAPDPAAIQKLEDKLAAGLAKKCAFDKLGPGFDAPNIAALGFPGPCTDANPGDEFTLADLQDCIKDSHDAALSGVCFGGTNLGEACTTLANCPDQGPGTSCRGIVGVEYDTTLSGPLTGDTLKCQREVAKNSAKFLSTLLKNVQKCRNDLLNCKDENGTTVCKLSGLSAQSCATNNPKTASAITKARDKALAAIESKCAAADLVTLKLCEPDQATAADAATCEIEFHQDIADNPDPTAPSDLIDFQYAQRGTCGDNRQNQVSEECDGLADTACPGLCGGSLGFFPCLCQNVPRTRVIEHANADLDNGYKGNSHDSGIVEGGGYVTDLWDCDGPGGPDTECAVGPSCSLPPHSACSPLPGATGAAANADTVCANLGQGTCRKTPGGSTGPHCEIEFKKRCKTDPDCPTAGDRCVTVEHGAPLPLVSGGVSVCVVNTFTEDVVGTTDLATGGGSVRLRQNSATWAGGDQRQPCPVCGGFCSGPGGSGGPGVRSLCTTDADCSNGAFCVTENICSWGPDMDQPCRVNPPGGGPTEFFGNPSRDCRMGGTQLYGTIDILFNPATTSATSQTANFDCGPVAGFQNKVCAGGTNEHRPCTVASECPGGTCNEQCFCPLVPSNTTSKPNDCEPACLGGALDSQPCTIDDDCPGGFCHAADCRENPLDTDSAQEGLCTAGPFNGRCSVNTFVNCNPNQGNTDCEAPICTFCEPGETCNLVQRECFVNPTRTRVGVASLVPGERISAALFCISASGSSSVDGVAGLPGPGAITQPTTTIEVGF
jgi:hypothetical protein